MHIGIDIDGVLNDMNSYVRVYFKKYLKSNKIPFKLDKTKERYYQQYNVSQEIENEFWNKMLFHFAKYSKRNNNADKIINKLHRDGHKLTIITSRTFSCEKSDRGEKMRAEISKWLAKNHIYYDDILYSNEIMGKEKIAKKAKIDIMIDDSLRNINELSSFVKVIIFKNSANKKAKGKTKYIAGSWKEVYNIINSIVTVNKRA